MCLVEVVSPGRRVRMNRAPWRTQRRAATDAPGPRGSPLPTERHEFRLGGLLREASTRRLIFPVLFSFTCVW